jgi:hypothetical protein
MLEICSLLFRNVRCIEEKAALYCVLLLLLLFLLRRMLCEISVYLLFHQRSEESISQICQKPYRFCQLFLPDAWILSNVRCINAEVIHVGIAVCVCVCVSRC